MIIVKDELQRATWGGNQSNSTTNPRYDRVESTAILYNPPPHMEERARHVVLLHVTLYCLLDSDLKKLYLLLVVCQT
jgi:hypothetical protein